MPFPIHTKTTAPQQSQPILEQVESTFGFVPNIFGVLAESPTALHAYSAIMEAMKHSGLSLIEQQVAILAVSTQNGCTYCVAAHSTVAGMLKMPVTILNELRDQQPLSDPKLEALRAFTLSVVTHRGWVPQEDTLAFTNAGYERRHILDVLTIVAQKTLSNYVNHLAHTPLDAQFSAQQWDPPQHS